MKISQKVLLLLGALIIISVIGLFGPLVISRFDTDGKFVNQNNNTYSFESEDLELNSEQTNNETEKYPCHTFEEWCVFLLEHYNITLQQLSELPNSSLVILNEEARIYTGWSNGTYTDDEKSQLLQELHNTPNIAFGVWPLINNPWPSEGGIFPNLFHHTDENFECVISIQNFILGEHVFRVYAYIDWDTGDTDKNYPYSSGDWFYGFADGAISKVFPTSGDWLNYLGKYPWDADLNPNEAWMGPDRIQILKVDQEQGWPAQSYTVTTHPGRVDNQINFVIQVMWRWDEVVGFGLWKPWFKWVTRQTDIYMKVATPTPFNIYDDDTDRPVLTSINYKSIVGELEPYLAVTGTVDDYSDVAVIAYYYGDVIQGLWNPSTESFIIILPTDRIGTHNIPLVFTDLDIDRENDRLVSEIYYVHYIVKDDDDTPPNLYLSHTGSNTDRDSGYLFFSISDPDPGSDATGTLTIEGPNDFYHSYDYAEGTFIPKLSTIGVTEPGEYTATLYAENNDEDRGEIDEETREITISFTIIDDDEVAPEIIEVVYPEVIEDNIDSFTIKVSATDESGIIWVEVDYEGNSYYGIYNNTDGYYWINVLSPHYAQDHLFKITVWDNDDDRNNDRLYNSILISIKVEDDDITPPLITSIDFSYPIYDSMDIVHLEFDVIDTSGIYEVEVTFEGQVYTLDYSGPHYAFNIFNPKSPGVYQLTVRAWDNDYDSWEGDRSSSYRPLSFTVMDDDITAPLVTYVYTGDYTDGNPGTIIFTATDASGIDGASTATRTVLSDLGTQYFTFTATDADNDRLEDSLSTTLTVPITIDDDDKDPPVITYEYTGDYTDGNPGTIIFTATDASGIDGASTATRTVLSDLGTQYFTFTVTDADNDRLEDSLSTTLTVPIKINDDDIEPPNILNLFIQDEIYHIQILFDVFDDNYGDDEGVSLIIIFIDGEIALTYEPSDAGMSFDFIIPNEWAMNIGQHNVLIEIWDADDDREGDSLYSVATGTFFITFEEMKQYIIWEIDQFIVAIQESPDELWGDPTEQRKNAMTNKLLALRELVLSDVFDDAYDKMLYDIKPLLTGLKTDENNIDWGNGVFKNAWVIYEDFEIKCDEILSHLQILLAENN